MSPKFLNREEIYRLLQRELPEKVYPDGAPSAYFSTADQDSIAGVLATAYGNLERISINQFPQDADERIGDHEIKWFGELADASLSLTERQARVLRKVRQRKTLALWEVLTLVASYVPEGTYVQIVEWGCKHGEGASWAIGVSRLGVNTALGWGAPSLLPAVCADCLCDQIVTEGWRLGSSALGTTTKLWDDPSYQTISAVQRKAYTYEIRIFDYEVTGNELARMLKEVNATEPARSGRVLRQNQNLADYGLIFPVTPVDQFSLVSCITRDVASSTGYSGIRSANGQF